jgi:hypothetical protein
MSDENLAVSSPLNSLDIEPPLDTKC